MSKKDNIEDLIIQNLNSISDYEPAEGHFERFEAKLKQEKKLNKTIHFTLFWKIAAAAVFLLLVVNQAVLWLRPDDNIHMTTSESTGITLAEISPEYQEVEYYYTSAINVGMNQWENLVGQGLISEEEQIIMQNEIQEFEKVFNKLQNDLALNPNDERVINAMLEYYQTKLSIITLIVAKLQEVKQKNDINDETTN